MLQSEMQLTLILILPMIISDENNFYIEIFSY